MQIVETTNEGLKRAYTVTIPAKDITARIEGEIKRLAPQVRMPGFRPGKVPANLVRKMHGDALHQEALSTSIREAMDQLVSDKALRPAMQPQVALGEGYAEGKDAELSVSLEVLPAIAAPSLEGLKLEKLIVPVTDAQVDEAVSTFASGQTSYEAVDRAAQDGDQVICDFLGKKDGVPFEGGQAEGQAIVIGSGRLIPGFEDQLVGMKAGDERVITVTFPEDYPQPDLKGKEATFDIKAHEIKAPAETKIDDDFAKNLGLEGLQQLRDLFKGQIEQETSGLTRTQMKRQLLDQLAAGHDFDVPPSMVDAEFEQIWAQLENEAKSEEDPAAALAEIEAEKDDYRKIAERRVRLGLLLSEIGQSNGVDISQQEMGMLIQQAAQQYRPQDRERFVEYVRNDPMAAAQLRAPLYEDKVVDFLIGKAEVTEREVTRDELQAAIEADADDAAEAKPAKKAAAKKAPAEKKAATKKAKSSDAAVAEEAAAEPAAAEAEPAAKKAPAKKSAKSADADEAKADGPVKKPATKKPAKKAATAGE